MTWIWLLIVVPVYFTGGGFTQSWMHNRPGHDRVSCNDGSRCPCILWAGICWPLIFPALLIAVLWKTGQKLEGQRPVYRRKHREAERKKDLRKIEHL